MDESDLIKSSLRDLVSINMRIEKIKSAAVFLMKFNADRYSQYSKLNELNNLAASSTVIVDPKNGIPFNTI